MYVSEAVPELVRSLAATCLHKGRVLVAHGRNRGGEQVFLEQVCPWGTWGIGLPMWGIGLPIWGIGLPGSPVC